jgi:spermidine synthase
VASGRPKGVGALLAAASRREITLSIPVRLALVSFASLYLELVLIRWLGTELPTFEYFKHLPLLAAFLGMGLGAAEARRPGVKDRSLFFVLMLVLLVWAQQHWLPMLWMPRTPDDYTIWQRSMILERGNPLAWAAYYVGHFGLMVSAIFGLCLFAFRDMGRWIGLFFNELPALKGYGINLAGSLAGVAAVVLIAYFRLNPMAWFALAIVSYIAATEFRRWQALCGALAVCLVGLISGIAYWTPYYRIDVRRLAAADSTEVLGLSIISNHSHQQFIMDLRDSFLKSHPSPRLLVNRLTYDLPYRFAPRPKEVLVLGAGCGNDVAAALRNGAQRVDAVEIDPDTPRLGRRLHPERPYDSPRVELHTDDARAFLRTTGRKYDLIVYGFLDAHILLATSRNIRMDNYLYTTESFQAARRVLRPGGTIAVSFGGLPVIWDRIHNTMEAALGPPILRVPCVSEGASMAFIWGPRTAGPAGQEASLRRDPSLPISTDDWPYLYLHHRKIPFSYWVAFASVTATLLLFVWPTARLLNRTVDGSAAWRRLAMLFLLGAAFMLVEVKSISQLALLFSSTWLTSATVIAAVLVMALMANMVVAGWKLEPARWMLVGIVAALGLGYFLTPGGIPGLSLAGQRAVGAAALTLPVLMSGLLFSAVFRDMQTPGLGLAANLCGAFVGCLLENMSMVYGVRILNLVAMGLYIAAWAAGTSDLQAFRAWVRGLFRASAASDA